MNGSLGTLLSSSVPSSLSSAVRSPEDERRCALFSVGDEHAAVSRAASPAPIKVLLSTLVGSCPLPGLLWLAEAWSVIIERVSLSVLRTIHFFIDARRQLQAQVRQPDYYPEVAGPAPRSCRIRKAWPSEFLKL